MEHDFLTSSFISSVETIAQEAGAILASYLDKKHSYFYKDDGSFATEADIASEKFVKEKLAALLPQASIIAEESGEHIQEKSSYCWVIDPLDGTTNFAHGLPLFVVSLALTYNNEPLLGVIYDPLRKELFSGCRGKGAFLNGQQLQVSSKNKVEESLIGIDVSLHSSHVWNMQRMVSIYQDRVYGIRKIGAACVDLCYVAAGRLDAIFLEGYKWWDVAAGMVIVEEAQGKVSLFEGKRVNRGSLTCLASNGLLHQKLQQFLV